MLRRSRPSNILETLRRSALSVLKKKNHQNHPNILFHRDVTSGTLRRKPNDAEDSKFNHVVSLQALQCLAAIVATGFLPALAIRPAKRRSLHKEGELSARVCDATLLLLLASHFLGDQRKNVKHQTIIYLVFLHVDALLLLFG